MKVIINKYKDYIVYILYSNYNILSYILIYMNITETRQYNFSDKVDNSSCLCPQRVENENKDTWEYFEKKRNDKYLQVLLKMLLPLLKII
jgi:hypothetical protein